MYGIHTDFLTGTVDDEKVGKDVSTPIASFPTSPGYKISNTNSITHIRTSGNTKLHFQTLIFRIISEAVVSSAAAKTATSPSKNITVMRLTCFRLKRKEFQFPGFYAIKRGKHFPCCPANWFLIANIRLTLLSAPWSKYTNFNKSDKKVTMAPVLNYPRIVPWHRTWSRPGQYWYWPVSFEDIMFSMKNFL